MVLLAGGLLVAVSVAVWLRLRTPSPPASPAPLNHAKAVRPSQTADPPVAQSSAESRESSSLTAAQRRGKQIYLTGISPAGSKMTAVLGNSTTEVPAAVLTCVNCHRHDGRGKPEGGIYPSNIRWDELTKPYGSSGPQGGKRPPYDEPLLRRSIAMGLGPQGRQLDDAMPRYRMTHQDLDDLVAYLKVVGHELDPGLTAEKIRVGVVLAPRQLFPEMHASVRAAVTAFVAELNEAGGVYHREIELRFAEAAARREDRGAELLRFVRRDQPFALAAAFLAGAEQEIATGLAEMGVPLIGGLTHDPQVDFPLNRHVFYLTSGLPGQGRALLNYARRQHPEGSAGVVLLADGQPSASLQRRAAQAIVDHGAKLGWKLQPLTVPAGRAEAGLLVRSLQQQSIGHLFSLLPGPQTVQLLESADEAGWHPDCYVMGALAGPELFGAPSAFHERIRLSFPTLPPRQPAALRKYERLAQRHRLPESQLPAQFEALSAVKTLVEGLRRTGASTSRERLIEELEQLYEYRDGFTPTMTFGPNRRIGAEGAFLLTVDLKRSKLAAASDWVDGAVVSAPRPEPPSRNQVD